MLEQTREQLASTEHKLKATLAENTKQYEVIFRLEEKVRQKSNEVSQHLQTIAAQNSELAETKSQHSELSKNYSTL